MDFQEYYNPFSLREKSILVTGASNGIGRATAIECLRMGATVYATGRNQDRLEELSDHIPNPSRLIIIPADLTESDGIEKIVEQVAPLDGAAHCAGIGDRTLSKSIREKDIERVMKINFEAPVLLQRALLKKKKIRNSGSIVFIASKAAKAPTIGNSLYSASKGALISFSKVLALELAPNQIRVNCISPAMVWTNLVEQDEKMMGADYHSEEKKYPLGRYGQPHDIAYLVLYLLSDCSQWMTGSNLEITGGTITL